MSSRSSVGQVRVDRSADAVAPTLGDTYRAVQTAPFNWVDDTVAVEVVVDGLTLEVFVNGGEASLTSLVFVDAPIVSVTSIGGDAKLDGVTVERLVG